MTYLYFEVKICRIVLTVNRILSTGIEKQGPAMRLGKEDDHVTAWLFVSLQYRFESVSPWLTSMARIDHRVNLNAKWDHSRCLNPTITYLTERTGSASVGKSGPVLWGSHVRPRTSKMKQAAVLPRVSEAQTRGHERRINFVKLTTNPQSEDL
jgi:hypothetical protein